MVGHSIVNAFKHGQKILSTAGISTSKNDSILLLCHIIKCDKVFLHAHPEFELTNEMFSMFEESLKKRSSHVPIQYITGICEFMSLEFYIDNSVLIPRQDTETLVETVFEHFPDKTANLNILDIGTGSGCVAISLAKHYENSSVTAIDISENALLVAKKNCLLHNLQDRLVLIKSNLFENLLSQKFDIIVSNPPYIPSNDIESLELQVKSQEPRIALDGGHDGLDFYRKIIVNSPKFMTQGAFIALEGGINQSSAISDLLSNQYEKIAISRDISGIERVICGYYLSRFTHSKLE